MQRQTDTKKWNKVWFQKLKPLQKCLWGYLCDNCDSSGVIDIDLERFGFFIGAAITQADITALGDKVLLLESGKLLIRKFIAFHWGNLSDKSIIHQSVIKLIHRNKIDGLFARKYNDKEDIAVPVAAMLKGREVWKQNLVFPYKDVRFFAKWEEWIAHRKRIKKLYKSIESEQAQLNWFATKGYTIEEAIEVIDTSTRNEYQGLFALTNNNKNGKITTKGAAAADTDSYKRELAARMGGTARKGE